MEHFYHQQQTTWNLRTTELNSYFNSCDTISGQPESAPISVTADFNGKLIHCDSDPTRSHNLGPFDPGFAERAARFSKFGSRSFNGLDGGGVGNGCQIPRNSSCQALRFPDGSSFGEIKVGISRCDTPENEKESSTVSEKLPPHNELKSSRKRKSVPRGKKEMGEIKEDAKRTKSDESNGMEKSSGSKNGKAKDELKSDIEAPKDYIHVRARRGQATDSHSLAERVRREKISQKMKFLQDLVPGCNKVTGKAVMLDEIINYVQSLQRQVEFLSMKLSTLNPTTDINMEAVLSKDLHQARSLLSQSMFALESCTTSAILPYGYQSQGPSTKNAHSDSYSASSLNSERQNHGTQFSTMDGFEQSASQVSMWIDELHNVVQMGYGQDELQNC